MKNFNPNFVTIDADMGYENGIWFDIEKGIKGVLASRNNKERVYIVTRESSPNYYKLISYDREPVLVD